MQLYLANTAVLKIGISAEDITSDYMFLLRLVNTFPIDTDEYITQCVTKLNYAKRPLKTLYIILQYAC